MVAVGARTFSLLISWRFYSSGLGNQIEHDDELILTVESEGNAVEWKVTF